MVVAHRETRDTFGLEMRNTILAATLALFTIGGTRLNAQPTIAFQVPTGTEGNQFLPGDAPQTLGLDFDVNEDITIFSLGVFDSGSDGLSSVLTVHVYDRDTQESVAQLTFTPRRDGRLIGGSRFLPLHRPLRLPAGFHGVIAVDYITDNNEMNGNLRVTEGPWTMDDGDGLISFVGSGRIGYTTPGAPGVFPNIIEDSPSPNVYAAGTFIFAPTKGPHHRPHRGWKQKPMLSK